VGVRVSGCRVWGSVGDAPKWRQNAVQSDWAGIQWPTKIACELGDLADIKKLPSSAARSDAAETHADTRLTVYPSSSNSSGPGLRYRVVHVFIRDRTTHFHDSVHVPGQKVLQVIQV
jgi:hypothetical protein